MCSKAYKSLIDILAAIQEHTYVVSMKVAENEKAALTYQLECCNAAGI